MKLIGHIVQEVTEVRHCLGQYAADFWGVEVPAGEHPVYMTDRGTVIVEYSYCTLAWTSEWAKRDDKVEKPWEYRNQVTNGGLANIIPLDTVEMVVTERIPGNWYSVRATVDGKKCK